MPGKLESVISVVHALKIFVTWRAKWRQEDCVDCYCDYNDTDAQRFIDYTEEMMQQFENMTLCKKKKKFQSNLFVSHFDNFYTSTDVQDLFELWHLSFRRILQRVPVL